MYLFEKILLCCKEMNPNKTKTKMKGPPANPLRNGKPKLQLKGRIFMQNVTETHYSNKPGKCRGRLQRTRLASDFESC